MCGLYFIFICGPYLLLIFPGGYETLAEKKYSVFLVSSLVFVFLSLLAHFETFLINADKLKLNNKLHLFKEPWHFAVFYLFFTGISAVLSPYAGTFWGNIRHNGFFTLFIYIVTFLLLRQGIRPKKWMLYYFGIAASLFCALGIIQLAGKNPFYLFPEGYNYYGADVYYSGAYFSTIGNVDFCAAFLSLCVGLFSAALILRKNKSALLLLIPFCLAIFSLVKLRSDSGIFAIAVGWLLLPPLLIKTRRNAVNFLLLCAAAAAVFSLCLAVRFQSDSITVSFSNSAILCALAALLLLALALVLQNCNIKFLREFGGYRKLVICVSVVVLVSGLVFLYAYPGFAQGTLFQAHMLLHGKWDGSFGSGRLRIWKECIVLLKEAPVFGGGPDTLIFRGLTPFTRYNETIGQTVSAAVDAAHNEYLNILTDQGILAFIAWLSFLWGLLWRCFKSGGNISRIAGSAVLLYLIQAFFGISTYLVAPILWLCCAVASARKNTQTV